MNFARMVYPARLKNERQRQVWLRKLILRRVKAEFYSRVNEIYKHGGPAFHVGELDYTGVELINT